LIAPTNLVEPMGSDVMAHLTLTARGAVTDDIKELAEEEGGLPIEQDSSTTTVIARISPRTQLTEGEQATVYVDTDRLHYFDPDDGTAVWGDETTTITEGDTP